MAKPTPQWHSPTRQTPIRFHFSAPSVSSRSSSSSSRSSSVRNSSSVRSSPCSSHLSSPTSSPSASPASSKCNSTRSSPNNHDRRLSHHSTASTTTTAASSLSSSARQQQQLFTHIRAKFQQGLHTLEDLQTFLEVTIKNAGIAAAADKSSSSRRLNSSSSSNEATALAKKEAHRAATAKALKPHQPSVRNLLSNMIIMAKWLVDYLHTVEREDHHEGECFSNCCCNDEPSLLQQQKMRRDAFPVRSTSLAGGGTAGGSPESSPPVSPLRLKCSSSSRTGAGGKWNDGVGGGASGAAARAAHAAIVQELRGELHSYSWRVMRITTILKEWL